MKINKEKLLKPLDKKDIVLNELLGFSDLDDRVTSSGVERRPGITKPLGDLGRAIKRGLLQHVIQPFSPVLASVLQYDFSANMFGKKTATEMRKQAEKDSLTLLNALKKIPPQEIYRIVDELLEYHFEKRKYYTTKPEEYSNDKYKMTQLTIDTLNRIFNIKKSPHESGNFNSVMTLVYHKLPPQSLNLLKNIIKENDNLMFTYVRNLIANHIIKDLRGKYTIPPESPPPPNDYVMMVKN